jgi:hypothetical protein
MISDPETHTEPARRTSTTAQAFRINTRLACAAASFVLTLRRRREREDPCDQKANLKPFSHN